MHKLVQRGGWPVWIWVVWLVLNMREVLHLCVWCLRDKIILSWHSIGVTLNNIKIHFIFDCIWRSWCTHQTKIDLIFVIWMLVHLKLPLLIKFIFSFFLRRVYYVFIIEHIRRRFPIIYTNLFNWEFVFIWQNGRLSIWISRETTRSLVTNLSGAPTTFGHISLLSDHISFLIGPDMLEARLSIGAFLIFVFEKGSRVSRSYIINVAKRSLLLEAIWLCLIFFIMTHQPVLSVNRLIFVCRGDPGSLRWGTWQLMSQGLSSRVEVFLFWGKFVVHWFWI